MVSYRIKQEYDVVKIKEFLEKRTIFSYYLESERLVIKSKFPSSNTEIEKSLRWYIDFLVYYNAVFELQTNEDSNYLIGEYRNTNLLKILVVVGVASFSIPALKGIIVKGNLGAFFIIPFVLYFAYLNLVTSKKKFIQAIESALQDIIIPD